MYSKRRGNMRTLKAAGFRRQAWSNRPEIGIEILEQFGNELSETVLWIDVGDYWRHDLFRGINAHLKPKRVIFNDPATIVYWNDGTKTVVKCDPRDSYSKEAGLSMCYMKKMCGSSRAFNDTLKRWTE